MSEFNTLGYTAQRYYILYKEKKVSLYGLQRAVSLNLIEQKEYDVIIKEIVL